MGIIKIKNKNKKHEAEETLTPNALTPDETAEQIADGMDSNIADAFDEQDNCADDTEQIDILGRDRAIVSEDETQTTENSRLYYLNNGTAVSVISAAPSNYFDEEQNRWEKIDNTLTDVGDEYENVRSAFKTRISKADKKRAVRVGKKDLQVTWEFKGKQKNPNGSTPVVLNAGSEVSTLVSFDETAERPVTTLEIGERSKDKHKNQNRKHKGRKLCDRAIYNNAENQTDLEYRLYGDHIKENIIVREKSDDYRYAFALQTQGLQMRLSEDNLQIELYREKTDADGSTEQIVEFTIPAPYMFDAAGNSCDDVYYELEPTDDGTCSFVVVASAEWINAEDRAFPVTIDPQIVMNSGTVITKKVERQTVTVDSCQVKHYSGWQTYNTDKILVSKSAKEEIRSELTIKRSKINVLNQRIAKATLYVTNAESKFGGININGSLMSVNSNSELAIDITSQLTSGSTSDIVIKFESYENTSMSFTTAVKAPYIKIEYLTNEQLKACTRDIDLVGGAKGFLNVATGEFTPEIFIASGEGLCLDYGITQIFKQSSDNFACGTNFRLNLHEKLELCGDSYIYTDVYGMRHGFKERFYYIDGSGNKKIIDKSRVDIKPSGELFYSNYEVIREEVSDSGLRASTTLQNVSHLERIEQRQSEIKQLEDQIAQYKSALEQFVIVDTCKKEIKYRAKEHLNDLNLYGQLHYTSNSLLMTESEAYSYFGTRLQVDSLDNQGLSYIEQTKSLEYAKEDLPDTASKYLKVLHYDKQIEITRCMHSNTMSQKALTEQQLAYMTVKSEEYEKQSLQYYKEYIGKSAELDVRKRLTPVHYLMDGELVKGFNEDGELVVVSDNYNNAIAIERDSKKRITRVYDDKEKQIVFKYNHKGVLSSVTDVRGKRTTLTYNSGNTVIKYANGKSITLAISNIATNNSKVSYANITEITAQDKVKVKLTYDRMLLTGVEYYSLFNSIAHGSVVSGNNKLSSTTIAYTPNQTVVTTTGDVTQKETYKFNNVGNLAEYYVEKDNKVVQAEKYDYEKYKRDNVQYAKKDTLNKTALSSFAFVADEYTNVALDQFNNPVTETTGWKVIHKAANGTTTKQKTETKYEYNEDYRVIEERTVLSTQKGSSAITTSIAVKTYAYNAQGGVVRTESYIAGEELTSGKSIEETVYDDKGRVAKSFTYNSLDSSSRFYKESETDENGKVIAEIDETGENKTQIEYAANSDNVSTKILPNGGKLSYGYDIDDNVTAITQSTEDGESNSNQTEYTNSVVTKHTSSNNTVMYKYDHKLRKTAVYLNSDEPYVEFNYTEDQAAKRKTVKSTLLNYDVAVTVRDFRDNVVKTQYNNTTLTESQYDAFDKVTKIEDKLIGNIANFTYDALDRITQYKDNNVTETYSYNDDGNISARAIQTGGVTETYAYTYKNNAAKDLDSITVGSLTVTHKTDVQGRNTGKEIYYGKGKKIAEENIYYRKVGDHATNMPVSMRFGSLINGKYSILDRLQYKYDSCGNITEIRENDILQARYEYDKLNRIVREDNKVFGKTWLYSYDYNGNILSKKEYAFTLKTDDELEELDSETVVYGYYGDRLMSFGEELCDYDLLGNPTTYRNNDLSWVRGRQLDKFGSLKFIYDGQGRRTKKGDITFTYDSNGKLLKQSNGISFIYDESGVVGLKYGDKTYIYRKDVQGNIIAILDSTGDVVVEYTYDAWGNHVVTPTDEAYTELSQLNPFRYRGYYYDTETGLYFLKTRYYDPEVGRFITIDDLSYLDPDTINGLNLYAYCGDNPVMAVDPNGNAWYDWLLGAVSLVAGIALCFVPGGQGLGVALMVGGISSTLSNTLSACGVDSKISSIVSSCFSIVAGIALCFTPFAGLGASMIGSGVGGIAGGFISEACGGSFATGAIIGNIVGGIIGGKVYDGIKTLQLANKGAVVLGEGMNRVNAVAAKTGAATYGGMPGYSSLDKIAKHSSLLDKGLKQLGLAHNARWIRWVSRAGVDIIDIGVAGTNSPNYLMEILYIGKWLF